MIWLCALFAKNDASADSVIVAGLFSLFTMTALDAFQVVIRGSAFDPTSYAMAAGGIIAAIAGSKRLRDGGTNGQSS